MADDWECTFNNPVMGVTWWGSFPHKDPDLPGYIGRYLPTDPCMPIAFEIGFWSSTADPCDPRDSSQFRHPHRLLEVKTIPWAQVQTCPSHAVDRDPRFGDASTWRLTDSCFEFYCDLSSNPFNQYNFRQYTEDNIFWISIAAVYGDSNPTPYVWGWKTRFDGKYPAVRITRTNHSHLPGGWLPNVGDFYYDGSLIDRYNMSFLLHFD